MVRLTAVLQVQLLQHHKNQHRHLLLPFLCQVKVRLFLQMGPLHAPSVSLQTQHGLWFPTQHGLRFPTQHGLRFPTLGLTTLQETQQVPSPVNLQVMGVSKPVQDPIQMTVATLPKHNSLGLRLDLHHLCLPMFQGTTLETVCLYATATARALAHTTAHPPTVLKLLQATATARRSLAHTTANPPTVLKLQATAKDRMTVPKRLIQHQGMTL